MISLFDTHTHMDSSKFDSDRVEAINRAREAGVDLMLNIGFNRETIPTTLALAEQYDFVYAAVGWHPVDSIDMQPGDLEWIEELCSHPKVVAIGEIGLDYHWDTSPKDVQQRVFREQIQLARKVGKPIVIHNRDAHEDIVKLLKEENAAEVGGVMHCFSGSWETARKMPRYELLYFIRRTRHFQKCKGAKRGFGKGSIRPAFDRNRFPLFVSTSI